MGERPGHLRAGAERASLEAPAEGLERAHAAAAARGAGYVSHELAGSTFVYKAEVHATRVAARAVRQIIDRLCAGSVEQFLVGMVDEHVIPRHELARMARKVRKQR